MAHEPETTAEITNWSSVSPDLAYAAETVTALLRESGVLADWFVEVRINGAAPTLIAYVVPAKPLPAEHLERTINLRESIDVEVTVVRMSTLPRTPLGAIDLVALRNVPVIDRALIRRTTNMLYSAGMSEVQVRVVDAPLSTPVGNLDESRVNATIEPAAASRVGGRAPAISHGPDLDPRDRDYPLTLSQVLERSARSDTGLRFIDHDGNTNWTSYQQIHDRATRIAGGLITAGVEPGQPILLQCGDNEQFVVSFWGCQIAGAVPVPCTAPSAGFADAVNERLEGVWETLGRPPVITDDIQKLPTNVGARGRIFRPDEFHEHAPADAVAVAATATALMLLTSGSTGVPKLVTQTHEAVLQAVAGMQQDNALTEADVTLNWFPLDHVVGLLMCNIRDTWLMCEQIHVSTALVLSEPLYWIDLLSRYSVTTTWAPNFAFSLVASRDAELSGREWDLSRLRAVINGGEMVVAEQTIRFLQALAPYGLRRNAIQPMWGMSETCSGVTYSHSHTAPSESGHIPHGGPVEVGRPVSGLSLRIVNAAGQVIAEREEGHLEVAGAVVTKGYFDNDSANAAAFTDDGWFRTGDRAFLDGGALTLVGRTKDEILINGVNTPANEIETVAERVEGARKSFTAAVAYRPAGATTDELVVFFSPADGYDASNVSRDIRRGISNHFGFTAKQVIGVSPNEIPKTAIGKIQRSELVARLRAGHHQVRLEHDTRPGLSGVWLGQPTWKQAHPAPFGVSEQRNFQAVGMSQSELQALAEMLRTGGHRLSAVSKAQEIPNDPDLTDVVLNLGSGTPRRADGPQALIDDQARCIEEIASVVRTLEESRGEGAPDLRLTILTSGTIALSEREDSHPVLAALRGFLPNLAAEYPWLRVRSVDVEPGREVDGLTELLHEVTDERVAYRDGQRWVMRFAGLNTTAQNPGESRITPGGFYLVVGGMGGIGTRLSRYLLAKYDARVLVVGRRPQHEIYTSLEELRRIGHISYSQADAGDEAVLEGIVAERENIWGQPLLGAFHLAGQLSSGPVRELTELGLRRTLASKVAPAAAIGGVLAERDGFVVAFSSVNAVFGGVGVAAYGAANGYLEAWTHSMNRRGVAHHVILWSQWSGIGMGADGAEEGLLSAVGYRTLTAPEGLAALETVLMQPSGIAVVGLVPTNSFITSVVARVPIALDQLAGSGQMAGVDAYTGPRTLIDEYGTKTEIHISITELSVEDANLDPDLVSTVRAIWSEILNVADVPASVGFFDAGAESLHLPRVQRVVEERLGVRLEIVDFFRFPTSMALATRLAQEIREPHRVGATEPRGETVKSVALAPSKPAKESPSERMRRLRSARQE